MLLACDVGNTNTVIGLYRGIELLHSWRVQSDRCRTADEWAVNVRTLLSLGGYDPADLLDVIIASVVPPVSRALMDMCRTHLGREALAVGPGLCGGMAIDCEQPAAVGADRLVNAVAAFARHQRSLIVIDFGTATTFDVVDAAGRFLGGAIAPGLAITAEALHRETSQLPRVALACPPRAIAANTAAAMQSGIFFGYLGLIEGLLARIRAELTEEPRIIATGGLAGLVAPHCRAINEVDPDLTLEGLRIIHARHRGQAA